MYKHWIQRILWTHSSHVALTQPLKQIDVIFQHLFDSNFISCLQIMEVFSDSRSDRRRDRKEKQLNKIKLKEELRAKSDIFSQFIKIWENNWNVFCIYLKKTSNSDNFEEMQIRSNRRRYQCFERIGIFGRSGVESETENWIK